MENPRVSRPWLIFILVCTFALTGCPAKKPSNDGKPVKSADIHQGNELEGGYDWGGGESIKSSPALVRRTIDLAQKLAGEQNIEKGLFRQFLTWNMNTTADDERFDTAVLFPNSGNGLIADVQLMTESPALKAISQKKITLLEKGDCPRPASERSADASVSKHNLDGDVCFSVGNLSKISPSDLTRQVMGLMLHEAVHLAGGGEDLAIKFQESFNVFFGMRFGEMLGEAYLASLAPQILELQQDIEQNSNQIRQQAPIPHIYAVYGRVFGSLSKIHGISDKLGIRLRLALRDEQAADDLVTKVERFKNVLGVRFHLALGVSRPSVYSYEELTSINAELLRLSKEIWASWGNLERAALCNERGEFLYRPKTWLLQDVCKTALR